MFFNKKKEIPKPKLVNIPRYTEDTARMCCLKIQNDNDYQKYIGDTMASFCKENYKICKKLKIGDATNVRIVPIHDNYFVWLLDNKTKHSVENLQKYMLEVPDEDVQKEMDELDWSSELLVSGVLVCVTVGKENAGKSHSFKLSPETCKMIEKNLEVFDSCYHDFYVPGIAMKLSRVAENVEKLSNIGIQHFENNQKIVYQNLDEISTKETENLIPVFVPVFIKYNWNDVNNFISMKDYSQDIFEFFDEWHMNYGVPEDLEQAIQNDFGEGYLTATMEKVFSWVDTYKEWNKISKGLKWRLRLRGVKFGSV